MANRTELLLNRLLPIAKSYISPQPFKHITCNPKQNLFSPSKANTIVANLETKQTTSVTFLPSKPYGNDKPKTLRQLQLSMELLKALPKNFSFFRKDPPDKGEKRIPKLILLQNPFKWLMIKVDFHVLKSAWDPTFEECEFKYGTKQAISRVTQVISEGNYQDLSGLLTKPARLSLLRELERNWNERNRGLLALKHEDIQISSPRKVYFIRIADKRFCDVDMSFLALKWAPINNVDALIFTEIFARFHREYTTHCIPEWTIAYFKVTRFEVLRR